MFSTLRQYPSLSNDLYSRPSLNPRDRYLAALAEAKAAEADYLAAEAIQREEDALRLRLQEIELQKRHNQPLQSPHSYSSYGYPQPHSHDRLTVLRRQLEEEELKRVAAVKQRDEFEEARILALKRKEEEEKLELLTRRRQEEEKRLLALRQEQHLEKERQRARACAEVGPGKPVVRFVVNAADSKKNRPNVVNHCQHPAFKQHHARPSSTAVTPRNSTSSSTPTTVGLGGFEDVLKLLFGQATPHYTSSKPSPLGNLELTPRKEPDASQKPILRFTFDQPKATSSQEKAQPIQGQAATTSAHAVDSDLSALKERLANPLNDDEASEVRDTIQAIFASLADAATNQSSDNSRPGAVTAPSTQAQPLPRVQTPTSSLKEELERRLYSDEAVEIQDTIQAIFASLADAGNHPSSRSDNTGASASNSLGTNISSSSMHSSSGKGKEKSTSAEQTTSATEPTSGDVLKSMQTVQNIETSFHAVQSDFVFPSQLDFTPTSSRESSPAPSNNVAEPSSPASTILKLAYTSRNQPVRYYEQTLSALLTQLDGVESFGNEEVRGRRKYVVGRVERAIEELEEEIEGRWRTKVRNEEKEQRGRQESVVTAPVVAQEAVSSALPAPETSLSEPQSTQKSEPRLVDLPEPDLSDPNQTEGQDESNTPPSSDDVDVVSISSESNVITEDEHNLEAFVKGPETDSTSSTYPPTLSSYPPILESPSLTLYSSPSIPPSTISSVATIRPYDVEPEPTLSSITSPAELNATSSTSEHDLTDDREEVRGQKVDAHSDSDWSEVDA